MKITQLSVTEAFVIDIERIVDDRGFFSRTFCEKEIFGSKESVKWVQANISNSKSAGTLRGLHFQLAPFQEQKLVSCTSGSIWDVVVDLRPYSPSFMKWDSAILSRRNGRSVFVPKGCAHGFITLEEDSDVRYLVSEFYTPDAEKTLRWDDSSIAIEWPAEPTVISAKDENGITLPDLMKLVTA
jgi:dTDP-4-dehydrorhamnose 3,5-epimerase